MAREPLHNAWDTLVICYSTRSEDFARLDQLMELPTLGRRRRLPRWYERVARKFRRPTRLAAPTIALLIVASIAAAIGGGLLIASASQFPIVRRIALVVAVCGFVAITFKQARMRRRSSWSLVPRFERHRLAMQGIQGDQGLEHARSELRVRRERWEQHLRERPWLRRTLAASFMSNDWHWASWIPSMGMLLCLLLVNGWLPSLRSLPVTWMLPYGILACYLAPWVYARWKSAKVREKGCDVLMNSACPCCGYDLRGVPCGIVSAPEFGPRRCPECVLRWPLVPPKAPRSGEAEAGRALL